MLPGPTVVPYRQTVAPETPINAVSGRRETHEERLDRNFDELLQELRVAQAGTQILFAFLLTVALGSYIQEAGQFERRVLAATLLLAAAATALLIAPVALHRVVFHRHLKDVVVGIGSHLAWTGLLALLAAMVGACLLALDALMSRGVAVAITSAVAAGFLTLWVAVPLWLRARGRLRARTGPPRY